MVNVTCRHAPGGACLAPHALLSDDVLASHVRVARNEAAWSASVRKEKEFSALWHILGENTAIMDY